MFLRFRVITTFLALLVSLLCSKTIAQNEWEWYWNNNSDDESVPHYFQEKVKFTTSSTSLYSKLLWFYKDKVSPKQGERCPCFPSCSTYTLYSMQEYGFFWGFIMGVDRIYFRESLDVIHRIHYLTVRVNNNEKVYDPPEANFIFSKKDWRIIDPVYFNLFFK